MNTPLKLLVKGLGRAWQSELECFAEGVPRSWIVAVSEPF